MPPSAIADRPVVCLSTSSLGSRNRQLEAAATTVEPLKQRVQSAVAARDTSVGAIQGPKLKDKLGGAPSRCAGTRGLTRRRHVCDGGARGLRSTASSCVFPVC